MGAPQLGQGFAQPRAADALQLAAVVKREKAKAAMIDAAVARAERSVEQEKAISGQPTLSQPFVKV